MRKANSFSMQATRARLTGCYVTVPTMFRDDDLELDLASIRRHVRFLIEGGIREGTGVLLAGGAAGDFSTMTYDERLQVAEAIIEEADGRVPITVGAQTTSTRELVKLVCAAQKMGADFVQVSAPYYFAHSQEDIYEYVLAAAEATDIGIILYNTFWTSSSVEQEMVERLAMQANIVGLKWSVADTGFGQFDQAVSCFSERFSIIDNQLRFITSHMLGARAIEVHVCNYWPEWGVRMLELLENRQYTDAQKELVRVALPFYVLWLEMEKYTSGDGYLDKLCMELVGLGSSRCRPPTRDVRDQFREKARRMLQACGVPSLAPVGR
ncbi:MAG: dihydrodipicolinate synthase family protein [Acidobacteria bacterium]|nr:dihydrodipicolinate synthase family protein [Acidobacteriota bacterium]MCI0720335.1 dihydrodipicolinate synthase family protein [Acidobacteriota bacterium]